MSMSVWVKAIQAIIDATESFWILWIISAASDKHNYFKLLSDPGLWW